MDGLLDGSFCSYIYIVLIDSAAPRYEELASEDNDVAEERHRVMANKASKDVLVLKNLFRQYGTHVAVDHTCVGVPEQECFGLLGQNGAGKTTTFKMLTGDVMASSGDAIVRGYSIKTDIKRVCQHIFSDCLVYDSIFLIVALSVKTFLDYC